jgi:acyl carrier protein
MTREQIRESILATLQRIAPEVDPRAIRGDESLRDQVDLDSMDVLNLMIGLSEKLGIDIPESDYGRMTTLDGAVAYLEARTAGGRKP